MKTTDKPQPLTSTQIQKQHSEYTEQEKVMATQIVHVNQLIAFPLSPEQIIDWTRSVIELRPDVTPALMKEVIDAMKTGIIDYDVRKGVQNIFNGLDDPHIVGFDILGLPGN